MKVYIHPHLALGDTILVSPLIRQIALLNSTIDFRVFCRQLYMDSTTPLYSDITNIKLAEVNSFNSDDIIQDSFKQQNIGKLLYKTGYKIEEITELVKDTTETQFMQIGHAFFNVRDTFARVWYNQFNFDFNNRWNKFHVNRNSIEEERLYNLLVGNKNEYIVIHEDCRYRINRRCLPRNIHIVELTPNITNNVFHFMKILEGAKEIHCIESFLLFICDSFDFKAKLISHRYAREYPPYCLPSLQKKWNFIENYEVNRVANEMNP